MNIIERSHWGYFTRSIIISCVLVLACTSGCATPPEKPPAPEIGASNLCDPGPANSSCFYKRETKAKRTRLIVFVHGVFGTRFTTWGSPRSQTFWPAMISADERFSSDFDIYLINYRAPYVNQAPNIHETAGNELEKLRSYEVFKKYEDIYFIGHSMGGLVIKSMLNRLNHGEEVVQLRKVKAVVFLATPAQGAKMGKWASWFSLNPQLKDMFPASENTYLQSLEDQWVQLIEDRNNVDALGPRSFCAYEELTYNLLGIGLDYIVPRELASSSCDGGLHGMPFDHVEISNPTRPDDDPYLWVMSRIDAINQKAQVPKAGLEWKEHKIVMGSGTEFPTRPLPEWRDIACIEQDCWLSGALERGGSSGMPTVCGRGMLLHSIDRGVQWREVDKQKFNSGSGRFASPFSHWSWEEIGPIEAMIFRTWRLRGEQPAIWGWLATCSGIYETKDGGEQWHRITPSPDKPGSFGHYGDIDTFEGVSEIYAGGWQGITHSVYPYESWKIQMPTYSYAIGGVFVGPRRETWAVGHAPEGDSQYRSEYYGGIYHLPAGSQTWERLYRSDRYDEGLWDIFVDDTTAIVVGTKGLILRGTRDESGNWSWTRVPSGVESSLNSVAYTEKNGSWIVGEKGVILFSDNRGKSWTRVFAKDEGGRPIESSLFRIRFTNSGMGWIVGAGVVLCTKNEFNPYCGVTIRR